MADFVQRGRSLVAQKQFQEAVKVCRLGLLAHPTEVEGRLVLAQALLALGRHDEVLSEMRVALELEPRSARSYLLKGEALLRKGDFRQAAEVLGKVEELEPGQERARALAEEATRLKDAAGRAAAKLAPGSGLAAALASGPSTFTEGETKTYPVHRGAQAPPDPASGSVTVPANAALRAQVMARREDSGAIELDPERDGIEVPAYEEISTSSPLEIASRDIEELEQGLEPGAAEATAYDPMPAGAGVSAHEAGTRQVAPAPEDIDATVEEEEPVPTVERDDERSAPPVPLDDDDSGYIVVDLDSSRGEVRGEPRPPRGGFPEAPTSVQSPASARRVGKSRDNELELPGSSPRAMLAGGARASIRPAGAARPSLLYDDDELESTTPEPPQRHPASRRAAREEPDQPERARIRPPIPAPAPTPAPTQLPIPVPSGRATSASPSPSPSSSGGGGGLRGVESRSGVDSTPGLPHPSTPTAALSTGEREAIRPLRERAESTGRQPQRHEERPAAPRRSIRPEATERTPRANRADVGLPRRAGRGLLNMRVLLPAAIALAIAALSVGGGLLVRKQRLDKQVRALVTQAEAAAREQTYRGYARAESLYRTILSERGDAATRHALWRTRAAIAAEFGEPLLPGDEAAITAAGAAGGGDRDLSCARVYVALAAGDAAEAVRLAREASARFPQDPEAAYLLGRALLSAEDGAAAVTELRRAVTLDERPLSLVAQGLAEEMEGRAAPARAAFDRALAVAPGHPPAIIERARLAAATGELTAADQPEGELRALLEEGAAQAQAPARASRAQLGWASLALAEVKLARGDGKGARQALAAAAESRPTRDRRFSEALQAALLSTGDTAGARAEAERAAGAWPKHGAPRVWLARVALAERRPDVALAELERAGAAGTTPAALAVRGQAKLALGDLDGAARDLDEALAARPGDRAVVLARAQVDLRRGDARAAATRLEPLYGARPDAEVAVAFGAALRLQGDRARARKILDEAARQARAGGAAFMELARLDRDEGKFADARAGYARAIEAAPARIDARLEASTLAFDLGDAVGARDALAKLVVDAPGEPEVLLEAVRVRVATGDLAGARQALQAAGKIPLASRWKLLRETGRVALAEGRPADAAKELSQAVTLAPDDGETRLLYLDALLASSAGSPDLAAAQAALVEVNKRFFGHPEADLARGRVHLAKGDAAQAIQAFTTAGNTLRARNAPPRLTADALVWLGRGHDYAGDLRKAQAMFADAARQDPSNVEAHYYQGLMLQWSEKFGPAAASFQRAVDANPAYAEAWFGLGESSSRLPGRGADAVRALQKYLELVPKGENAGTARTLLKRLK